MKLVHDYGAVKTLFQAEKKQYFGKNVIFKVHLVTKLRMQISCDGFLFQKELIYSIIVL